MTPGQRSKQRWVASLAELEPDLVVDTGDNLAHTRAVPGVLAALDPLLSVPGVFVWGSNDYFGPTFKNPARYLLPACAEARLRAALPWRDLRAALIERGWHDATHARFTIDVAGVTIAVAGVDDPHIRHDRYDLVAGPARRRRHAQARPDPLPRPRVLDAFAGDGYDLVLAGHTHGGQLRLPGYGAIVTNCGLDRSRARGASRWGSRTCACTCPPAWAPPRSPRPVLLPARGQPADPRRPPGRPGVDGGHPRGGSRGRRLDSSAARRTSRAIGVWRSLVARFVRDEEVAGSNPVTPTRESPGQTLIRTNETRPWPFAGRSGRSNSGALASGPWARLWEGAVVRTGRVGPSGRPPPRSTPCTCDELIVAHQAPTPAARLRSVELLAEAMTPARS